MLARTSSKCLDILHGTLFLVLNTGLEKTQVSKALINRVLMEQLMRLRADANIFPDVPRYLGVLY